MYMTTKSQEEIPRFIGNKPALALKRFAGDLEISSDPDRKKFQEINKARVDNFIRKPYENTARYRDSLRAGKEQGGKKGFYDYSDKTEHHSLQLDAPELQRSLGPRSRYGDGDGSFWDKWINTEMPSKGLGIDEKGLPIAGQAEVATMGYKRLYNNRSHDKSSQPSASVKPRTRAIIQPYSERKAKRLQIEASEVAAKQVQECSSKASAARLKEPPSEVDSRLLPSSPGLSGADWKEIESLSECDHKHSDPSSPIRLPPVTALEKDAYFGHKARAEFLDIFRQLSRQRHVYKDSKYDGGGILPVDVKPIAPAGKATKLGRSISGGGGRFTREISASNIGELMNKPSTQPFPPADRPDSSARRGMMPRHTGVQKFGGTGVLVRTNTTDNMTLQESAETEETVLRAHLKMVHEPGIFPRPLSPRSRFLLGCLNSDVVPRPAMLIRKEMTYVLNLEHQFIGDQGGLLLANSLNGLPYLAELNVGDNNLTDTGLTAIIEALHYCPYLTSLDVSENKIDEMAASALSGYLQKRDCNLINLVMRKSDVDDNEIGDFVQAIGESPNLKNIDLSANLIGSNQNRTPLHPGLTAGGKVLGDMLSDRSCRIESLKLAWNMIRFESGVALMQSLKENHSLTYLDVSYNGLGQEGAEMLGDALHVNTTLCSVLISNNNITPRGSFCIVSGVRSCRSLSFVDISNNPIGEKGAQSVMMLITELGQRVSIDIRGCSIRAKDDLCWYDPEVIDSSYLLNMAQPYERTVAVEMLRAAASSKGKYVISDLKYIPDPKVDSRGAQMLEFNLMKEDNFDAYQDSLMPPSELIEFLTRISTDKGRADLIDLVDRKYENVTTEFERNGKLTMEQMEKLLNAIGLGYYDFVSHQIFATYDTDCCTFVTIDEFKDFFARGIHDFVTHWTDAVNASMGQYYYALNGERYLPSDGGSLSCKLKLAHMNESGINSTGRMLLTETNMNNILHSLKLVDNAFRVCQYALTNCSLNFPEAWRMYNFMVKDCGDKRMVLRELLPIMSNVWDARVLLHQALGDDIESRVSLRGAMGPLYRLSIGHVTGFYALQLSKRQDRLCFHKLVGISSRAAKRRKSEEGKGDISQTGDWQGFRNCVLDGAPVTFTTSWIENLPKSGKIEFDFIHFQNPTWGAKVMSEERYFRLLSSLQMLPVVSTSTVDEDDEILIAMGVDELLLAPIQQQIDNFERSVDELIIPGSDARADVLIDDFNDCDQLVEYYDWCVENYKNRERLVVPKKFAPVLPATARVSSADSVNMSRKGSARSSIRTPQSHHPENEDIRSLPSSRSTSRPSSVKATSIMPSPRPASPAPPPPLTADYIVEFVGHRMLSCQQLAFIVHKMGDQDPGMFVDGLRKPLGSTRVELIVSLFNQIADLVNFPTVAKLLTSLEKSCLVFRLGWLAIWNPLRPDGSYSLRLKNREERQIVRVLITLLLSGPDTQFSNVAYIPAGGTIDLSSSEAVRGDGDDDEATWKLPASWHHENGLPPDGILRLTFRSPQGTRYSEKLRFRPDSVHSTMLGVVFATPPLVNASGKKSKDTPNILKVLQLAEQLGLSLKFGEVPKEE